MPSSYFSRLRTAAQRSNRRSDLLQAFFRPESDGRKSLSVVGAISRTFSVPSVSGPPFNACAYHADSFLPSPNQIKLQGNQTAMAASGSRILFGECSVANSVSSRLASDGGFSSARVLRRAAMSLSNNRDRPNKSAIFGYLVYEVGKRWFSPSFNPVSGSGLREFHGSGSALSSVGPAREVSFDSSSRDEQLSGSADSADRYVLIVP